MDTNSSKMAELGNKLTGLAEILGGRAALPASRVGASVGMRKADGDNSLCRAPPAPTIRPATALVLRSANASTRDAPLGGLLQKYRDAEAAWLKEKGKLMLGAKAEQQRRLKAEVELRRVQQQLAFRVGEVQHLKQALKGRDGQLQDLQDRLREYELAEGGERMTQEAVQQAQAERDELQAAVQEVLHRLDAANTVIGEAGGSMASFEAKLAAAAEERQRAEEVASSAQAEAQALRETVGELQWKCDLLQRVSDLTLQQTEEKSATLLTLLQSESMLDVAAEADGGCGGEGSDCGRRLSSSNDVSSC